MSDEKSTDTELSLEERDAYRKKLFSVVKHVNYVRENAELLAERIIETAQTQEDLDFSRRLIQSSREHDISKFQGIEWEALHRGEDKDFLKIAIHQHQQTNAHHPEYWGGITQMNTLQLAEMVCDLKARSTEMGTDLRTYIKERHSIRFGYTVRSAVYKKIKKYVDLLLDDTFTNIK
jgi:hypothetical protein|tara:strand:+ start:165 stop:695 length:531 start_codon:yes stop_codon:yes gene_type:complete